MGEHASRLHFSLTAPSRRIAFAGDLRRGLGPCEDRGGPSWSGEVDCVVLELGSSKLISRPRLVRDVERGLNHRH
jgi:hypothetical protein